MEIKLNNKYWLSLNLVFLLSANVFGVVNSQAKARRIYLLEDVDHKQWCAFAKQSTWQDEVDQILAMRVGSIDYTGDSISAVSMTEEDETGDWVVYDRYVLEKGMLHTLDRRINVIPGDLSIRETFTIHGGKAQKRSTSNARLSTGKSIAPSKDWRPTVSVITKLNAFPFSMFLSKKRFEVRSPGKQCMPMKQ